jgi:putative phosphoesterase
MRVGIFSDAHGHLGGFEAALSTLREAGAEELWYLGDFIGYIPTTEVVTRAMQSPLHALSGNHEAMVLSGADAGALEPILRHREVSAALTRDEVAYLASLPSRAEQTYDGIRVLFVHGSPRDSVREYIYPDTDLTPFAEVPFDVIFMGHTHRPFVRREHGRTFVNVGSCGIPRDDSGRGAACLFDTVTGKIDLMTIDLSAASRAVLERFDLAEEVARRLRATIAVHESAS